MSDVLREVVLIAATMTMGLMTGVFGIYGNAIMPGLRRTDDRTLVAAFQSIDRAIINPAFMATFVGALAFASLAALLQLAGDQGPLLPWIAAAFLLYLVVFVITIGVNMPRNNEIKAAGDIDQVTDPYSLDDLSACTAECVRLGPAADDVGGRLEAFSQPAAPSATR
jgi:uncharacterized membrane protein